MSASSMEKHVADVFPEAIRALPQADLPIKGARAYLAQGERHQILFMQFSEEVELKEHAHGSQYGVVLEGTIRLTIGGETRTYGRGERYYIPEGVPHSGRIFAGYADITFFDEPRRFQAK